MRALPLLLVVVQLLPVLRTDMNFMAVSVEGNQEDRDNSARVPALP